MAKMATHKVAASAVSAVREDDTTPPKHAKEKKADTVPMVREDGKTADVHPDEVENMKLYGWSVVK